MYVLRDPLFTFEACLPADVRRPRMRLDRYDAQWTQDVVRSLCRDEANRRIVGALVEEATGRAPEGRVLAERFAELVVCGRILLREVEALDVYPLPDPSTEHRALAELAEEPLADEEPRRTWISLELLHAAGLSTERVEVEVTTASGREVHGRLDAKGRWRCDDIEAGSCSVRLLEHPVLQRQRQRRRAPLSLQRPQPQHGDLVWPAGSEPRMQLRTAEHHRIVIVQPTVLYCPSA